MRKLLKRLFGSRSSKAVDEREDESFYFLSNSRGVLHIGANYGQERELYRRHNLTVLWVEAIPEVFQKLVENLKDYPNQSAVQYLLTDKEEQEYSFHLSNNDGASSSIFDFAEHKKIWPEVKMTKTVKLRSATLPTMLQKEGIAPDGFDALVMDTQGSELLILQGARPLLQQFRFVKTEVADFKSYEGGCVLSEMDAFMTEVGFSRVFSKPFAGAEGVGTYYEVVYRRN